MCQSRGPTAQTYIVFYKRTKLEIVKKKLLNYVSYRYYEVHLHHGKTTPTKGKEMLIG